MSRARARELVQEQLEELGKLRNAAPRDPSFKHWRQATLTLIQRVWASQPKRAERFRAIPFSPPQRNPDAHTAREAYARGCVEAANLLKLLLVELDGDGSLPSSAAPVDPPALEEPAPSAPAAERKPARTEKQAEHESPREATREREATPRNGAKKKKEEEAAGITFDPAAFVAELEARMTRGDEAGDDEAPEAEDEPPAPPPPPRKPERRAARESRPKAAPANFDLASLGAEFEARAHETDADEAPGRGASRERFVPPPDLPEPPRRAAPETPAGPRRAAPDVPLEIHDEDAPPKVTSEIGAPADWLVSGNEREFAIPDFEPPPEPMPRAKAPAGPAAKPPAPELPEFEMLTARTLATIAGDLAHFDVPEAQRAGAREHLLAVARGLDRGEMEWAELRAVLHFVIDHPELARHVLPLLVPYLDAAA